MSMREIIRDIRDALSGIGQFSSKSSISDFKSQRAEGSRLMLRGALRRLLEETKSYPDAFRIAQELERSDPKDMNQQLERLAGLFVDEPQAFQPHRIPSDIRDELVADLNEVQSCMNASCYRSAIILCGRVMETALHRKYYEATNQDLLEKAPGIGLGNLIAKLSERGVQLDPGLSNQIHLINQVRVFSVHTKQQAFVPSKMQAEAIVLYTLDILEKLFKR